MSDQYKMQDPTTQYPNPDIPEQSQPEPGLTDKMQPRPDHGEDTYRGLGRLTGRKALITGGDSGIGRAVALAFVREGADVVINYLPEEASDAASLSEELGELRSHLYTVEGDIAEESFCERLINESVEKLGGIDILVNNAGKQVYVESIEDLSSEQLRKTFDINIIAMYLLTKAALKHMPEGSAIINTTSIQATQPSPGLLDYAATKAAISNFTRNLAQQLASKGIRVNGVAPGPIWTPLQPSHGQPQDKLQKFGEDTPFGRPGQPAELAPAYVFLASQEASYISGEILGVTGGKLI